MIRLSKDRVLYNYNIDENGTIRDDEGVIQKTYIIQGRPLFKKTPVHRIMMYTFKGFRDGHNWHIHHIDGNKFNNKLINLVYLTPSEHISLHHKGKHFHHSEETKKKISENYVGMKGKHHTTETKHKISEAKKGNKCMLGHHHSEETKKKISGSIKIYWTNKK